jgi:DNA invertase Pin-like site-specific DNA recombinase
MEHLAPTKESIGMKPKPVDIYVRVSSRGGRADERFHSPEEQEALARGFLKSKGLTAGIVLTPDIDRSGGTVKREGLQQALERIRSGESSGFVVAWLDRFSRDVAQATTLMHEIQEAGGRVWAPEAPEDATTPEGELQLGMFMLVAQYQRKRARAGFQRAKERAILAGIPVGPTPVGYRQKADRTLEIDPDIAPVVRELFERRAAGDGYGVLARFLHDATGLVRTPEGITTVITRRLYATGRLEYAGMVSDHDAGAIVDEPLWHAAQRPQPLPRPARSTNSPWLLSGLLVCSECGRKLSPWTSAPQTGRIRRYRCRGDVKCPRGSSIAALLAERIVVARAMELSGELISVPAPTVDLAGLEVALAKAEARLAQVMAPDAMDALGDEWVIQTKARRLERDQAAEKLGRARSEAGVEDTGGQVFTLGQLWPDLTPAQQREALAWYLSEVVVHPVPRGQERTPETFDVRPGTARPWRPLDVQPTGLKAA